MQTGEASKIMAAVSRREVESAARVTPEQYLARERQAERKSEYYGRPIVAMPSASWQHNLVTGNIAHRLGNQLHGSECAVVTHDQRVWVEARERYYYPDAIVVCGEPQFQDAHFDSLLNPTVIVEALSDSTEKNDRGDKLQGYRTLDSLSTCVLVSTDTPLIEVYHRREGEWLYTSAKELDAAVVLDSIGCTLRLSEVYDRVTFPRPGDQSAPDSAASS